MVLTVAVPVQRFKQVLGVLMLASDSATIDNNLRSLRFDILKLFGLALVVTFLLSVYLAGAIARPMRRLAVAAERVRRGHGLATGRPGALKTGAQPVIPDMTRRGDEIGELSGALKEMTEALWQRLDAIERFAADVSHEIKNPLTSLKSAIETAARVQDPVQQQRLMGIVLEDVARIDRLIGDISSASRLDAELSRAEAQPVDIASMLRALVEMHEATAREDGTRLVLDAGTRELVVPGLEDRLGQVFRNIIANAMSFSPPGGTIRIAAQRRKDRRAAAWSRSRSTTRGRASPRASARRSSSASTASGPRARNSARIPASACRFRARSSTPMAGLLPRRTAATAAARSAGHASWSGCRSTKDRQGIGAIGPARSRPVLRERFSRSAAVESERARRIGGM